MSVNGRKVSTLMKKHKHEIKLLRKSCKKTIESAKHDYDDLALLRYVLSFGEDQKGSISALKDAIKWRNENERAVNAARERWQADPSMQKYMRGLYVSDITHNGGGPVMLLRLALNDEHGLMEDVPPDLVELEMLLLREHLYWRCDQATRETGRICKTLFINDMAGVSLSTMHNKKFFNLMGEMSKKAEKYFPQLMENMVMINIPWFFNTIFGVVKHILPKRSLEKFSVCRVSGGTVNGDITQCPFASKMLKQKSGDPWAMVPDYLGGTMPCPSQLRDAGHITERANEEDNSELEDWKDDMKEFVSASESVSYSASRTGTSSGSGSFHSAASGTGSYYSSEDGTGTGSDSR